MKPQKIKRNLYQTIKDGLKLNYDLSCEDFRFQLLWIPYRNFHCQHIYLIFKVHTLSSFMKYMNHKTMEYSNDKNYLQLLIEKIDTKMVLRLYGSSEFSCLVNVCYTREQAKRRTKRTIFVCFSFASNSTKLWTTCEVLTKSYETIDVSCDITGRQIWRQGHFFYVRFVAKSISLNVFSTKTLGWVVENIFDTLRK